MLELPDDVKSSVNAMSKIVDSYKNSLARALEYSPRMLTVNNAFVQLKEKKMSLSEIKESMYQDDFKYFILYVIKSKYEEIIDCTNMSYLGDDSEIIDFIADILGESKTFIEQLLLNDYLVHVNTTKTLSQELGIDDGRSFEIEFEKSYSHVGTKIRKKERNP